MRRELPHVRIAVDRFHLVALGNQLVTKVRQRTTRDRHGRRGRLIDPIWNNRRVLLTGADHLSEAQWARLEATFDADDPTGQVQTAWIIKQTKRVACGFRSMTNYRRRIVVHIAVSRQRQTAA